MIAVTLGVMTYAALCGLLLTTLYNVMGPLPDRIMKIIKHKWKDYHMLYYTVRYEDDDAGTWQIIEDRDGNRYRVLIRNEKGEMKW